MRWVRQEDPDGCGIAVLAMLTDQPYWVVRDHIEAVDRDWRDNGVPQMLMESYMVDRGWSLRTVLLSTEFNRWPPPAFAEQHFAQVTQPSSAGHYVAMDFSGRVFDPLRPGIFGLSDWPATHFVIGANRGRKRRTTLQG